MTEWIFCLIQSYQTIFVGLLGFLGVIITMLANAKIQRNQIKRTQLHEANSLRIALKSELNANVNAYQLRIEQFKEPSESDKDAIVPNRATDGIYKELLNKIGLLSENELEKIIKAYALLSELPYRIRILVGTDNIGGFENEFLRVKNNKLKTVLKIHESILPSLIEATEEIEHQLKKA